MYTSILPLLTSEAIDSGIDACHELPECRSATDNESHTTHYLLQEENGLRVFAMCATCVAARGAG